MNESSNKPSRYAFIHGQEAVFVERVVHGGSAAPIVVYGDPSGAHFYITEDEWTQGSRQFADRARDKGIVTTESPSRAKLALFRKLFKGRNDLYAHGYRKKDGGIGYAPACENEWKAGICPKKNNPHSRCAHCTKRAFSPASNNALIAHFKGIRPDFKDVVGLYVLDKDCKTSVLVADFDKSNWQGEITAYRQACKEAGITVAIERSRSGNGGHAWIFFSEPIDAALARNLGCTLITNAMNGMSLTGFMAYDRLFPAQTTIPEGGFGNLIALPFQGWAQREGNSIFVDERFEEYPDQWRFLSSIEAVNPEQVKDVVNQASEGPLGPLAYAEATKKSSEPWATLPKASLGKDDFPAAVTITKANMLFVTKDGLSPAAANRIKRLAAFGNPEFYRAQSMHQSVYGKPRIINLSEETEQHLALPRGCEERLLSLLTQHDVNYRTVEARHKSPPIDVAFKGSLRPLQQDAVDHLLKYEYGVLSAPTGFGKTVVGAFCIAQLKMRTLVIVPGTALLAQWQQQLEAFLNINEELPEFFTKTGRKSRKRRSLIGQIGGGKNIPSGIIDIATFQSLFEKGDVDGEQRVKELVREYDFIICDECHHGAAPQLERVLRFTNARRVYGLSATPKRADGLEKIIFMQCGPIRHEVDPKTQAAEQGFTRHLQPRFTKIRLPKAGPGSSFNQILDLLCNHATRNQMIIDDTVTALEQGHTPLVITKRKDHAAFLAEALEAKGKTAFLLTGGGTTQEKRRLIQNVKDVPPGRPFVLVATGSYIGEGFDDSRLDALILAAPASWEGVITQYSGRLHREHEGKNDVVVYDYIDASVPMLDRMYKKRLRTYKKLGYELIPSTGEEEMAGRIVNASDFRLLFSDDLLSASKSIFISAPYLGTQCLSYLKSTIDTVVSRGIALSVTVGRPSKENTSYYFEESVSSLRKSGCKVSISDEHTAALAIIDEHIVWYGSIPLLAFPKKDDCSLRFENSEIAFDLLSTECR